MSYTTSGVAAASGTGSEPRRETFDSTNMQNSRSKRAWCPSHRNRKERENRRREKATHCERERRQDPDMHGDDRGTLKWRNVFCTDNMESVEGVTRACSSFTSCLVSMWGTAGSNLISLKLGVASSTLPSVKFRTLAPLAGCNCRSFDLAPKGEERSAGAPLLSGEPSNRGS